MPLHVFQSIWAMTGLPRDESPWSSTEQFDAIADAGYDGVSISFHDPAVAVQLSHLAAERDLGIEVVCYPTTSTEFDDLLVVLEQVQGIAHIDAQPLLRTPHVDVAAAAIQQWYASAGQAGIPLLIETHRARLTCDILFTAELVDLLPEMRLTADLAHYVTGDEFGLPLSERNQALIDKLLERSDVFHGRVSSPGQIQVPLRDAQTEPLLELFSSWWQRGFELRRATDPDARVVFTTELGPPSDYYGLTNPDGTERTDRWAEALDLADIARALWTPPTANGEDIP